MNIKKYDEIAVDLLNTFYLEQEDGSKESVTCLYSFAHSHTRHLYEVGLKAITTLNLSGVIDRDFYWDCHVSTKTRKDMNQIMEQILSNDKIQTSGLKLSQIIEKTVDGIDVAIYKLNFRMHLNFHE